MDAQALHLSRALDEVAGALAAWTADRLGERQAGLAERHGARWREEWSGEAHLLLAHLAQAIALRRPALFAAAASWSRRALIARGGRAEDHAACLECLRSVLDDDLPPALEAPALAGVDAALAALSLEGSGTGASAGATAEPALDPVLDPALDPAAPHGRLLLAYLEAVLAGRSEEACGRVLAAAAAGVPVAELHDRVLAPAQREIGRMWHSAEINVADEHRATAVTLDAMARLRGRFPAVEPANRRVVAVTPAGDLHEVGLRAVADTFAMAGWSVDYLGANVPHGDVVRTLAAQPADLVAVSVGSPLHLRAAGELIATLAAEPELAAIPVVIGGAALAADPDLWRELGAAAYAASGTEAVAAGERLTAGR